VQFFQPFLYREVFRLRVVDDDDPERDVIGLQVVTFYWRHPSDVSVQSYHSPLKGIFANGHVVGVEFVSH
jgi:hypothetical protein